MTPATTTVERRRIRLAWGARLGPELARPLPSPYLTPLDGYVETARMLEAAGVGLLLLDEAVRPTLGPAALATRIAMHTTTLGVVPQLRIGDCPPYMTARVLTTMAHLSGGRIGWGLDTALGPNLGATRVPAAADRDAVAAEYVDVVRGLWNTWRPGALVEDRATGTFADPSRVAPLDHEGTWFRVKGPLNLVPSPHGVPLVQRAGDAAGYRSAGRHADVVVLEASSVAELIQARRSVAAAAAEAGRDRTAVLNYAAVRLRVARTEGALGDPPERRAGVTLTGTPGEVADQLEQLHDTASTDGVLIEGDWDSRHVTTVCQLVVSELRGRGLV